MNNLIFLCQYIREMNSLDLGSDQFNWIKPSEKEHICKYVYGSLDGSIYDIACFVYFLYNGIYKVAKLSTKQWFVFDDLKWKQSELGPYYQLSTQVVDIYKVFLQYEYDKRNSLEEQIEVVTTKYQNELSSHKNTLKNTYKTIIKFEKLIDKLKNVNSKDSICKECLYLFYDPDFLYTLDSNPYLICFNNGIFDLEKNILRQGNINDNVSIVINSNFVMPKTKAEKQQFAIMLEEFQTFRQKILYKRQNKLVFVFQKKN